MVCLLPSEVGFSLIDRLVREVIKITRGVLARVFFFGVLGVGIGGVFGVFCCCRESAFYVFFGVCFLFAQLYVL